MTSCSLWRTNSSTSFYLSAVSWCSWTKGHKCPLDSRVKGPILGTVPLPPWLPGTCGSETRAKKTKEDGRKHGRAMGRGPRWEPPSPSSGVPSSVSNTGQACMGELDGTRAAACGPEGRDTHRRPAAGPSQVKEGCEPPQADPSPKPPCHSLRSCLEQLGEPESKQELRGWRAGAKGVEGRR